MFSRDLPPFTSLSGSLLIAMPNIEDKRFQKAVIYITHHSENEGAKGLVINKPIPKISCQDILAQLKIQYDEKTFFPPVLDGGPDHKMQGFILHTPDLFYSETRPVTNQVHLTATQEILTDIASGKAPESYLLAVGCCTWSPSQMEEEIMGNIWLTAPSNPEILFHTPYEERWEKALKLLGISPELFSARAGKA
ncbi:MAG: YqgE/AlgH family protein [Alphaproteobacteria bacterium]